jgi:hypothetical protein
MRPSYPSRIRRLRFGSVWLNLNKNKAKFFE